MKPSGGLEALLDMTRQGERHAKIDAAETLARCHRLPMDVAESILPALDSHSRGWEYAPSSGAAKALGLTGNPVCYQPLRDMLENPNLVGPALGGLENLLEHGAVNLSDEELTDLSGLREIFLYRCEWYTADYSEVREIEPMSTANITRLAIAELARRADLGGVNGG